MTLRVTTTAKRLSDCKNAVHSLHHNINVCDRLIECRAVQVEEAIEGRLVVDGVA